MSDPDRCKPLLEYILGIKIARIEYAEKQKTIDLSYDAKGVRLDLNVIDDKGIVYGDINDELKDALHYMAGQKPTGKFAKELDAAVQEIKRSDDWRVDYMTYAMNIREHELAAHRQGKKLGVLEGKIASVRNHKGKIPDEMIISILDLDKNQFIEISDMIDNYPDWTDEDIAADIIGE
ncbi:MAG: hypothetical protein IJT87_09185 [Ruminiclostridium sp.]|nr:hypothetical protein [Ruminiclostridium sp.]